MGSKRACVNFVAEVRRAPWGQVARDVEAYAEYGTERRAIALLLESVRRARLEAEAAEREEVARRVDHAIAAVGVSASTFAREVGTSASRLATYRTGAVQPSAGMLLWVEEASQRLGSRRGVGGCGGIR